MPEQITRAEAMARDLSVLNTSLLPDDSDSGRHDFRSGRKRGEVDSVRNLSTRLIATVPSERMISRRESFAYQALDEPAGGIIDREASHHTCGEVKAHRGVSLAGIGPDRTQVSRGPCL